MAQEKEKNSNGRQTSKSTLLPDGERARVRGEFQTESFFWKKGRICDSSVTRFVVWRGRDNGFSPYHPISVSDFLEGDLVDMIVEADLKLIKDAFSAKEIEANSKTFGESDGCRNLKFPNSEFEIIKIGRNVTAIPDHNQLESAILDIDSHTSCRSFVKDTKHGSGVNINPHLFLKKGNGSYRH